MPTLSIGMCGSRGSPSVRALRLSGRGWQCRRTSPTCCAPYERRRS
jgi:hypothetical protein